jgi:hypothetical protein
LETEDGGPDEAGFLPAAAKLKMAMGGGSPEILEEDRGALHDAAGQGEDFGRERVIDHLEPIGDEA